MDPHPGPVDPSVLYDQKLHRSQAIANGEDPGELKTSEHFLKASSWKLTDARVTELVRRAGFLTVSRLQWLRLDRALITALVERWRRETSTFHFRFGEMTITLQDVAILVGLLVDGRPVTGSTRYTWDEVCQDLLGKVPHRDDRSIDGGLISLDWLKSQFQNISADASEEQISYHARAYILFLIGCLIIPDSSRGKVHLRYLPLLRDFDECGTYAWGAAALANLYREMAKASCTGKAEISGFLSMLQLWSWERLHIGRPKRLLLLDEMEQEGQQEPGPLGCRWNVARSFDGDPNRSLRYYRNELDQQTEAQIMWQPYMADLIANLPPICRQGTEVWRSRTPLICFEIVEMHVPDRVLRQFGFMQHIPDPVEHVARITCRGRPSEEWADFHHEYVARWNNRLQTIEYERDLNIDAAQAREDYLRWYWGITRRFIVGPTAGPLHTYEPRGHIERTLVSGLFHVRKLLREALAGDGRSLAAKCRDICGFIDAMALKHNLSEPPEDPPHQTRGRKRGRRQTDGPSTSSPLQIGMTSRPLNATRPRLATSSSEPIQWRVLWSSSRSTSACQSLTLPDPKMDVSLEGDIISSLDESVDLEPSILFDEDASSNGGNGHDMSINHTMPADMECASHTPADLPVTADVEPAIQVHVDQSDPLVLHLSDLDNPLLTEESPPTSSSLENPTATDNVGATNRRHVDQSDHSILQLEDPDNPMLIEEGPPTTSSVENSNVGAANQMPPDQSDTSILQLQNCDNPMLPEGPAPTTSSMENLTATSNAGPANQMHVDQSEPSIQHIPDHDKPMLLEECPGPTTSSMENLIATSDAMLANQIHANRSEPSILHLPENNHRLLPEEGPPPTTSSIENLTATPDIGPANQVHVDQSESSIVHLQVHDNLMLPEESPALTTTPMENQAAPPRPHP